MRWLESLKFNDPMLHHSFQAYFQEIKDLGIKIDMMDKMRKDISNQERYKDKIDKSVCFTGIETHKKMLQVTSVLVQARYPAESIFNRLAIQESEHYLMKLQKESSVQIHIKSPGIIAYADRGTKRIERRMQNLECNRDKNANVATAAGARELACFVGGMMTGTIA